MVACQKSHTGFWNIPSRSAVLTFLVALAILVGFSGCGQTTPPAAAHGKTKNRAADRAGKGVSAGKEVSEKTTAPNPTSSTHPSVSLKGLHAYAQKSLDAGETLQLRVSSTVPYQMTIRRLHTWIDKFKQMESLYQTSVHEPLSQPIHPGSSICIPKGLTHQEVQEGFSLECWVRPWRLDRVQAIMTQAVTDKPHGFGFFLDAQGRAVFQVAAAGVGQFRTIESKEPLKKYQWFHLVATWKEGKSSFWVNGEIQGSEAFDVTIPLAPPQVPLRFGAAGGADQADSLADIDLAMPIIHRGLLDSKTIAARYADLGQSIPRSDSLLGAWPLDEEEGDTVHDSSGRARDGQDRKSVV